AGMPTIEAPGAIHSPILVVAAQDLVAWLELERTGDNVDAVGGIGHKDNVLLYSAEVAGQHLPRLFQQFGYTAPQKDHRVGCQLTLPLLIDLKDRTRASAETTMVEKGDIGIEQVLFGQMWQRQLQWFGDRSTHETLFPLQNGRY